MNIPDKKYKILLDRLDGCNLNGVEAYKNLVKYRNGFMESEQNLKLIDFLNALGNEERFLIIDSLKDKMRCVCELEVLLQKSQPTISHHLRVLEKQGIIAGMKKGKFTYYTLVKKPFDDFFEQLDQWKETVKKWFGHSLVE